MAKVSYTKLRSGSWGVRVQAETEDETLPQAGETVTVYRKDGSSSNETVTKLVWQGSGVALYALDEREAKPNSGE
jgi:hypothetical protein